jgi:phosphatidylglycerophosphatase A
MSREPRSGQKLSLLDRVAWLYATGCGVGLAPKAPGTFGSLMGPLLVAGWQSLTRPLHESVIVSLAGILIGVAAAQRVARRYGLADPGCVICDEVAAFTIVFAWEPVTWRTAALGFAWFRLFDIWKPWPIRRLERLPGGWGIMADDLLAGVFAAAALQGTLWLLEFVH